MPLPQCRPAPNPLTVLYVLNPPRPSRQTISETTWEDYVTLGLARLVSLLPALADNEVTTVFCRTSRGFHRAFSWGLVLSAVAAFDAHMEILRRAPTEGNKVRARDAGHMVKACAALVEAYENRFEPRTSPRAGSLSPLTPSPLADRPLTASLVAEIAAPRAPRIPSPTSPAAHASSVQWDSAGS